MVSKNKWVILFVVSLLVLTALSYLNLVSSGVVMVSPTNGTSGQNFTKTNVLFNVTLINATDLLNPLNATFYASPNGNGTWLTIGNTTASGCVFSAGAAAYNISCAISLNFSIADGNYTINATAYNLTGVNGTQGIVNMSTNVIFDSTAPAVVANLTLQNGFNVTTGTSVLNISVIDSLVNLGSVYFNITNATDSYQRVIINATNATAGASHNNRYFNATWNVSAFGDGLYNITIFANDTLANMNSSVSFQVRVDSLAPASVNFTSLSSGNNVSGTFVFNLSVSDLNSSIRSVMLNITNSTGAQNSTVFATLETGNIWVASVVTTGYNDGSYNITAYVNDTAGNQNTSVLVNRVIFDNTAPNVAVANFSNPLIIGQNYSNTAFGVLVLNVSLSDITSSIQAVYFNITNSSGVQNTTFTATNSAGNQWNATLNTNNYLDGLYNITVFVNDTSGNINSSARVHSLTFDNSAPSISLSCTPNPVDQGNVLTCTCSGSDAQSNIRSTSTPSASTANSGPHTSSCSTTNFANLSSSATFDYTVSGSSGSSSGGSSGSGSGLPPSTSGGSASGSSVGSTTNSTEGDANDGASAGQQGENEKDSSGSFGKTWLLWVLGIFVLVVVIVVMIKKRK
ncbi:MAG: Ig-like domain-containing protein [Nanoarchaeota archaeon]